MRRVNIAILDDRWLAFRPPTTTKKPPTTKRPPVTLSCPLGGVLEIMRIDGFDQDRKPAPAAQAKCPRVAAILVGLQKHCNNQSKCVVQPSETFYKRSACPGLYSITVLKRCVATPARWFSIYFSHLLINIELL